MKIEEIVLREIIDYNWFERFFFGKGCFFIDIYKSNIVKLGYYVKLCVTVGKYLKDELFVYNLISIFQCEFICKNKNYISYNVYKFKDIYYKMIPFFYKYKIE